MKKQSREFLHISTLLAFILIPLGGLTTDIYIPSLPAMAGKLNVDIQAVQLTLLLFMVSSGASQLFIGSILDSFGRYRINIGALIVFSAASFIIASVPNIYTIYAMRIIQGITVSLIIVGKRAFFVDMFSGERLKNYTSLFSIVFATAPIVAPFLGGYLQTHLGWEANFYLLGSLAIIVLFFELKYTGESLQKTKAFNWKNIKDVYKTMLGTPDFTLGLVIVGLSYSQLVIYGMVSPFIIEQKYGFSALVTGYSSLSSGVALMTGGIISKMMLKKPLISKLFPAIILSAVIVVLMMFFTAGHENIWMLLGFILPIHILSGFVFNNVYAYCLQRFTQSAGTASGLTGGGIYILSSAVGYGLIHLFDIRTTHFFSFINAIILFLLIIAIYVFSKISKRIK
ncbi:MFS transporter [Sphingobacterium siyangense]|uniref:MFS transporter n=1 Tax=Sphingobacterium siyangense TaxID=459529 RepID=UPI0019664C83|nr:MFS transporter [Sphingobacterium siyangense]QRY55863.1 MFS transporter [Sphingobacterium siyangense]